MVIKIVRISYYLVFVTRRMDHAQIDGTLNSYIPMGCNSSYWLLAAEFRKTLQSLGPNRRL